MEKTVNTITYGIFEVVSNFENIINEGQYIKTLVEFYNKNDIIKNLCLQHTTGSDNISSTVSNLNTIFTQGFDSNWKRCSPPDTTPDSTTAPSNAVADCNMDYVGYGYCSNDDKKCVKDNGDCICMDSPNQFDYPNDYYTVFNNYKTNVIANIRSNSEFIAFKNYFNNMKAYDKYIESSGKIATGYFSHCVLLLLLLCYRLH